MLLFVDFVVEFVGAEVLAAIRTPDFVMGTCELVGPYCSGSHD